MFVDVVVGGKYVCIETGLLCEFVRNSNTSCTGIWVKDGTFLQETMLLIVKGEFFNVHGQRRVEREGVYKFAVVQI